ncbi:hypothetical protein T4E_9525 [Trichinella pseudospiralis]|uniref:Uncharacterized protein n=1 Tax=Trichinella pseudospiralis TaxID=6337 RepID=A0A0V0YJB1_TRIPS|nr:hypothetical protein T4E_9525 [Trichinella pseudospiralis]
MFAVDLQVQCKVVSAYGTPCHNRRDNDLTKLGGKGGTANERLVYSSLVPQIQTLGPDMSENVQSCAFMLAQFNTA